MDNDRKLRQIILNEKEKLKDKDIFYSDRYIRMLKSIAREITDTHFDNINVDYCSKEGIAGRCNRKQIVIYINNAMTRSFPTLELRNRSIIGILAHECGHKNYSNMDTRKTYLEGIKEGIWYPYAPRPENEEERIDLDEMKGYFQKKDKMALAIIYEAACYIHNILEDSFIEEKMCTRFRGSVTIGIRQNRCRKLELSTSLREQIGSGIGYVAVMINLISQYTLSGTYNNWDRYEGEVLDVLESVKYIIDSAMSEDKGSMRIIATNQILLKMWKIFKKEIEEINHEQEKRNDEAETGPDDEQGKGAEDKQGTEPGSESENKAEKNALDRFLQQLRSQIPDFINDSDGEGIPNAITNDMVWDVDMKPADRGQLDTNTDNSKGETIILRNERVEGSQMNQSESKQIPDADEQLRAVIFELAKQQALHNIYKANMQEMKRELSDVEFYEGHKEVQKVLMRSEHVREETYLQYEGMEHQVKLAMQRLKASVYPILRAKENRVEHKLLIGKKIDCRNITDRTGRVFQKKHFPGQDSDTAISILIDMSASMCGNRIDSAKTAALCIYEFCRRVQIPITVYGHHTDGYEHKKLSDECVFLHSCAEFEPNEQDRYRILDLKCAGANRDGTALIYMGAKLLNRFERQKILLLISDGLPNASYYKNEGAKKDLKKIKIDLKKKGITFLAAAIGEDKQAIKEIYQESFVDISDLSKMPVVLSKKMLGLIRRG